MRRIGLCVAAAVALCGCDEHEGEERTPSAFMGAYLGTCEQTRSDCADYRLAGNMEVSISDRGTVGGWYTLQPCTCDELTIEVSGTVADDGQMDCVVWLSSSDWVSCEGVATLTGDGVEGEIVRYVGDRQSSVAYRLQFALVRQ